MPAQLSVANPATRAQAERKITNLLQLLASDGLSVLVGFDFPYGYPAGTANRLGLNGNGRSWQRLWEFFSKGIEDDAQNRNNRFAFAAQLNELMYGEAYPFWGCPKKECGQFLNAEMPRRHDTNHVPNYRFVEKRIKGLQPVWKIFYPGSVGGQALVGIPILRSIRHAPGLDRVSKVWPFETGFTDENFSDCSIVHTEIYPSFIPIVPDPARPKDAVQVETLCHHFSELDENGKLRSLFQAPDDLANDEHIDIENEEGWILGIR